MGNNIMYNKVMNTKCVWGAAYIPDDINEELNKFKHVNHAKHVRPATPSTSYDNDDYELPSHRPSLSVSKSVEYHQQKQNALTVENKALKQEIIDLKKQLKEMMEFEELKEIPTTPTIWNNSMSLPLGIVPIGVLSSFLEYEELLKVFIDFLSINYKSYLQLLEFVIFVDEFKEYSLRNDAIKSEFEEKARFIMNRYFNKDSQHYLSNLNKRTMQTVIITYNSTDKYNNFDPDLFNEAQEEIHEDIVSKIFPFFMQSQQYKKLVDDGKIIEPN